jgi:hypothetical protein
MAEAMLNITVANAIGLVALVLVVAAVVRFVTGGWRERSTNPDEY